MPNIGDIVNLSARLAVKAPQGEIWCSHAATTQLRAGFALESLGVLSLKGKARPQAAYRLAGEKAEARIEETEGSATLIGRSHELAQLVKFLAPTHEGRFAGVMVLYGDAGIGKSRLVDEMRRTTSETHTWLLCPADRVLRRPFDPFRHALRRFFELHAGDSLAERGERFDDRLDALLATLPADEEAAAIGHELARTRSFLAALVDIQMPGSLYEQLDPELRYENTMAALRAIVLALTLQGPLVLFVDDVQWFDADSVQVLKALTADVEQRPLAVVGTSRYDEGGAIPALDLASGVTLQPLALSGLDLDGVRHCLVQTLGADVDEAVAEFVEARTNGNAFYVEQLAVDLQERGLLAAATPDASTAGRLALAESSELEAVPASLSAVLVSRLDRLDANVKEVVQTASVLGRAFEASVLGRAFEAPVLARMLPDRDGQAVAAIEMAQSRQIWDVTQGHTCTFRHVLLRDAAYDKQLRARLRRLHQRATQAIEVVYAEEFPPRYGELTHHYGLARNQNQERTYAGLAGKHAAGEYANADAIRYLNRALELTEGKQVEKRHDLRMTLGNVYALIGEHADARLQYTNGLAEVETMGQGLRHDISTEGHSKYSEDKSNALEGSPPRLDMDRLNALSYLGLGRLHIDRDPAEAQRWISQSLDAAQSTRASKIEAECFIAAGTAYLRTGDWDDAKENLFNALTTAPENMDIQSEALLNLVGAHALSAELDEAESVAHAALKACRHTANPLMVQKGAKNLSFRRRQKRDSSSLRSSE